MPVAAGAGFLAGGGGGAASAALGVAVAVANFTAHGLSLAWAATISPAVVGGVALGGYVVRMAAIVGALFGFARLAFFSPLVFGLSVIAATLALLVFEARLVARGLGGMLELPPPRHVERRPA
jgi:hypothetical protein